MVYAVYAFTPKHLLGGGAIPSNVPNESWAPKILYGIELKSPWFDAEDNAKLATLQIPLPAGACALRILSYEETDGGTATTLAGPSLGILPPKSLVP